MTHDALYISNKFYLYLSKIQRQRDQYEAFEYRRDKNVGRRLFDSENMFMGPLLSEDK